MSEAAYLGIGVVGAFCPNASSVLPVDVLVVATCYDCLEWFAVVGCWWGRCPAVSSGLPLAVSAVVTCYECLAWFALFGCCWCLFVRMSRPGQFVVGPAAVFGGLHFT